MDIAIFFKLRNRLSSCLQGLLYPLFFSRFERGARILRPLRIAGSHNIAIGAKVFINNGAWLEAIHSFDTTPVLTIKARTYIGNHAHIIATQSIVIEENALIADRVYIADYVHGFRDPATPIRDQPLEARSPVRIGAGAWIGENAVLIGCRIGRQSVIGANSVVTSDIPDYCVAVGAPARVIRRYDPDTDQWVKVRQEVPCAVSA